jgi:alpha/beta superfamily hydrolase
MNPKPLKQVDLRSDAGRLEGLYRQIDEPRGVAVVCHPHPLHGGTLHNKVVFRAARGFERADVATLRFNFRGAGTSQGTHDNGAGEQRDVEAAIDWVQSRHARKPLILGGFSFGSWVASKVGCVRNDIAAMFLIGAPVNNYDLGYLKHCRHPILFLHGSDDEHGDVEALSRLVEKCHRAELVVVAGADHFFRNQVEVVEETIREWTAAVLEEARSTS